MKKILLFIIIFVGFYKISFASENIIYKNTSDGNKIYLKSDADGIENGIAITNAAADWIDFSWDGESIIYTNTSDGFLYKKSANDDSDGTAFEFSYGAQNARFSPDGQYIYYIRYPDFGLYKKSAYDGSTGSLISSGATSGNGLEITISPDGQYIIWVQGDSRCFKKSANDISNGIEIAYPCRSPEYSPDGQYIYYISGNNIYKKSANDSLPGSAITSIGGFGVIGITISRDGNTILWQSGDDGLLYKKSANDSLLGLAITNVMAWYAMYKHPFFVPTPPTGGNTGTTFSLSGLTCKSINYPVFTSSPYNIGNGNFSDNSSGSLIPEKYSFQWLANSNSYQDRFSVYPSTGIYLDTETFTGGIEAGKITTIYSDLDLISENIPTSLSVNITRTEAQSIINYVKIKTNNQGFSPINSNQKNIVAEVRFNGIDGKIYTYPMVYSGGYATALSRFPAKNINIRFTTGTVTFDGFEVGFTNDGLINKTSCANSAFICEYTQQSPGIFSCDSALNVSGIPQGECEISNNICQPKAGIIPYYDGAIVPGGAVQQAINSSGAVVGLDYEEEDIFTCDESGFSVLICPFQVIGKVWSKFTFVIKKLVNLIYGISSLGSPSGQGNIYSLIIPSVYAGGIQLDTPFDISGSGTSSESYTGPDMMDFNKTILKASDNVYLMDSSGIKGIYAISMWFLIVIGVVSVIVIILLSFK